MPSVTSNGITIEFESTGDPSDQPVLLIAGLGSQLTGWHEDWCSNLASRGLWVLRLDNRDVGLSSKMDDAPVPDMRAIASGDHSSAPYRLSDMAADTAGLLDALGIPRAHLVGRSMGGMIAQSVAIDYPDKVSSLCSIYSTTGDPRVGRPKPDAVRALLSGPVRTRDEYLEEEVSLRRVISSPGFPFDERAARTDAARAYDRCYCPEGKLRQAAAVAASPDRTGTLAKLKVAALVVHGDSDPLIDCTGGEATAAAIPGADLMIVEGMGHDLPRAAWPRILAAIVQNTQRLGGGSR